VDLHDLFIASELSASKSGTADKTYTKEEVDALLAEKVNNSDIITNATIDTITSN